MLAFGCGVLCDFTFLHTVKAIKSEWQVAGRQGALWEFGSQQVAAASATTSAEVCKTTTAIKT